MGWDARFQNNDPSYLEPRISNNENSINSINTTLAQSVKYASGLVLADQTKATANATIINNLLSSGKDVILPSGDIYIDNTLVMTSGTSIKGMAGTVLYMTTDNNVIQMKGECKLENLRLYTFVNGTKAGIYINQNDNVRNVFVKNIHMTGYAPYYTTERSIGINITGSNGYFTYSNFIDVTITNMYQGINITQNNPAWATSFNFIGTFIENCLNVMNVNCGRGKFDYVVQTSTSTQNFVTVSGEGNELNGFFYDLQNSSVRPLYTITSGTIKTTIVDTDGTYQMLNWINDYGDGTKIIGSVGVNLPITPNFVKSYNGTSFNTYPILQGKQDDALAFIHKRGTVNLLSGTITYGTVTKLFDYTGFQDGTVFDLTSTSAIIEIIPTNYLRNVSVIGMTGQQLPKKFNIYLKTTSGGSYTQYATIDNNINCNYQFRPSEVGVSSVYAIKIEILQGYGNTTSINKIWCDDSLYGGQTFIPSGGGKVYGDMNFPSSSNGVILTDTTNGHTYRLQMVNGVLTPQQVS